MNDLNAVTQALNGIKSLTNEQAAALLAKAKAMIDAAVEGGAGGFFTSPLPGDLARRALQQRIGDLLAKAQAGIAGGVFADVAGVKDAITRAAIEENAVAEGNVTLAAARDQFFGDLLIDAGSLYNQAKQQVNNVVDAAQGTFTTIAWAAAALALLVGAVYFAPVLATKAKKGAK